MRGAVSIGRRLVDPLAELVKIDPKSIGVGQYQHDVDQASLKRGLDDVVVSCVNGVGVELNTASKQLLSYVSGARAVAGGEDRGASRRAGRRSGRGRTCCGCRGSGRRRSSSARGSCASAAATIRSTRARCTRRATRSWTAWRATSGARWATCSRDASLRARIAPEKYVTETVGLPTLTDILAELAKPGRDPRQAFEALQLRRTASRRSRTSSRG